MPENEPTNQPDIEPIPEEKQPDVKGYSSDPISGDMARPSDPPNPAGGGGFAAASDPPNPAGGGGFLADSDPPNPAGGGGKG